MSKKILFICSSFMVSGKEFVTLHTAQGLVDAGFTIEFIINGWSDGKFETLLQQRGWKYQKAKLGWLYKSKPLWTLDTLIHIPKAWWKIRSVIKNWQPDFIYFDSYKPLVILKSVLKNQVNVYHVNDPHSANKRDQYFIRYTDPYVNHYIAASGFIKNDLMACGVAAEKITVIHNGVEVPADEPKQYQLNQQLNIGIVGQVIPRKGHIDLLNACKLLQQQSIPFVLNIYGSGSEAHLDELKAQIAALGIQDAVRWKGFENDKSAIYQQLDVLVAPTINEEPFALVALESSLHKVPVIATRSGGFVESVLHEQTGFIVEKHAPAQIAERLSYYFNNKLNLQQHGSNARQYALKDFTLARMHQKLVQFFNQLH